MKRAPSSRTSARKQVAPCAGAWIETEAHTKPFGKIIVAPCAGAWIETYDPVCSLRILAVAPCAGAWIETKRL